MQARYVQVAFPIPVENVFTYLVPDSLSGRVTLGSHVLAFLGRRKLSGFVVGEESREGLKNLKMLEALVRPEPVFEAPMLALARRVAEHYVCPLGEILAAAYPGHADKRPRAAREEPPGERRPGGKALGSAGPGIRDLGPGVNPPASSLLGPFEGTASRVFAFNAADPVRERLYVPLTEELVTAGGGALFLVPEVSSAAALAGLLKARFGPRMALFHSALRISERKRLWEDCRAGRLRVVVGTRSAVFLPLVGLGLMVVEDEHAQPYKQEETPRYNGRDVALMRGELEGIPVVLASATPSVETYLAIKRSDYRLFEAERAENRNPESAAPELVAKAEPRKVAEPRAVVELRTVVEPGKVAEPPAVTETRAVLETHKATEPPEAAGPPTVAELPTVPESPDGTPPSAASPEAVRPSGPLEPARPAVSVVDMRIRDNAAAGADEFSLPLASAIEKCLEGGNRALILLNRRGFSTYVQCQDCGAVETCPHCELPLVLHSGEGVLLCHHCGYKTPAPSSCRKCKGVRFRFGGAGIEKVVSQLRKIAPSARIDRIDLDSAVTREVAVAAADKFSRGELDILVGTLMVMKGFELGEIALVGVLHAETQLNIPDFRSGERAFELLSEVTALAGWTTVMSRPQGTEPSGARGSAGGGPDEGTADITPGPRAAGRVIIQTLNPDHHSVRAIVAGEPALFYEEELRQREELGYPPFATLVAVHISGPKEPQVLKVVKSAGAAASAVAESLERQGSRVSVLGPSPGYPARMRGQFRWRMSIRADKREAAVKAAREILAQLGGKHEVGGVTVSLDVDPVGA